MKSTLSFPGLFLITYLSLALLFSTTASADIVCGKVNIKNGKPKLVTKTVVGPTCPKKFTLIVDTAQLTATVQGPTGPQGAPGVDGTLRVYGDGSAGLATISSNIDWAVNPPINNNLQFTNFTVAPGITLTVPSGTVIRATGNVLVQGTITVKTGAAGGSNRLSNNSVTSGSSAVLDWAISPPVEGPLSFSAAQLGQKNNGTSVLLIGGFGGNSLVHNASNFGGPSTLLGFRFGTRGGSGGAGFSGGAGGGVLTIIAQGSITNALGGLIRATGNSGGSGSGGGGGGVLILASPTSIVNSGIIEARGGLGGPAANATSTNILSFGNGGGGGGGVVHLISPAITSGAVDLSGGAAGSTTTQLTQTFRCGGGGGGASGGGGGTGGDVPAGSPVSSGGSSAGDTGELVQTIADPTSLL
jgi:hypothetical protein